MNPNAGEPVNPSGGITSENKPINPVSGVVPELSVVPPSSNVGPDMPSALSDLEKLVNAARERVPTPTDSQNAFVEQFGPAKGAAPVSKATPIVEPPTAEVQSLDQQVASDIPQTVAAEPVGEPPAISKEGDKVPFAMREFMNTVNSAFDKFKAAQGDTQPVGSGIASDASNSLPVTPS